MRRRPLSLLAGAALLVSTLPAGVAVRANISSAPAATRQVGVVRPTGDVEATPPTLTDGGPLSAQTGPVNIVVELNDAPATRAYADAVSRGDSVQAVPDAQRQLAQIERAQQRVLRDLQSAAIDATVLYRAQRVYNGIAVKVDASKLAQIQSLPNVKAIYPLTPKTLDNASSVPLIGAPELWSGAAGGTSATGRNIRIGVIDTGIDYLHSNFGGSGSVADFNANNPGSITDSTGFPNAKVVGGYDFAGDDYDASDPDLDTPVPDPDPLDCNGHGSHVAGTAAGYGVNADGSTYRGAYNASTPFNSLRIGPGAAPEASLYALKVFGCEGSTNVTDAAIEYAVDPNGDGDFSDHLDVINMSLGSDYGSAFDTTAVASDNAAAIGVIVVASAGNSGDTYYISGSPGSSGRTIAVASSVDSLSILDGFRVNSPPSIAGVKPASNSVAFNWQGKSPVTGDLVYPASQPTGCQAFDAANRALIAGKVVLLDWTDGQCGSVARGAAVVAAGGIGFILADNSPVFDLFITGSAQIPAVSTPQSVGQQLKTALSSGTVNVTLSPEFTNSVRFEEPDFVDTLSSFSSRGPRRGDAFLKPDLAAPGQSIFSTAVGTGNQGTSLNGTSMAAPHVAGSMALLRQIHPSWTVEELKALAMNTANTDVLSGADDDSTPYAPARTGAGRITVPQAATSESVAYNANDAGYVSVSFGSVEVVGSTAATKNVRVVNKSNASITYTASFQRAEATDIPGVSFSISPASFTVPANGSANVVVTMTANAAAMRHTRDTTVSDVQNALPRHWLSEESGLLVINPAGSSPNLRVPVHVTARPASEMRSATASLDFGTGTNQTRQINLVGQGVGSAAALTTDDDGLDEVSIATAFELQHSSPDDASSAQLVNNADLKYVGVTSSARSSSSFADANIAFGIATHGNWSSPNETEFDIYIDTNRDGDYDYVAFNWNASSAAGGADANDVFVVALLNLNAAPNNPNRLQLVDLINGVPSTVVNTVLFNTNVMMLPIPVSSMGLTASNATFDYQIVTFSRDNALEDDDQTEENESIVDLTPVLTFNAAAPGLNLTANSAVPGLPAYADLPGTTINVTNDRTAYGLAQSQGVLLLHHHNTTTRRAEVLDVTSDFPNKVYFPIVLNGATLSASLSGANEVPAVNTEASGTASFSYNSQTRELSYTLDVRGIDNITMAHIHRGAAGQNGPIIYPLYMGGGNFGPGNPLVGSVRLNAADEAALFSGGLYVNVHTTDHPGGEVRGQIVVR